MQTPRIERKGPSWIMRYMVKIHRDSKLVWVQRSKKLAPVSDEFRTEASVRHLAQEILAPLNSKLTRPESTDTVLHFLENVYLPDCKENVKPSTYANYSLMLANLRPHIGNYLMRKFTTVEAERVMNAFAKQKPRAQNVLKNTKGFLSGAFRHAVRTGVIPNNPMHETVLPKGGIKMADGYAYSLKELAAILKILPEPARTIILTAALTGLRGAELRGLKWEDFDGETIRVQRSVWRTHIGSTKTAGSAAPIPVIPVLAEALNRHKQSNPGPYIFSGPYSNRPINLHNLVLRVIKPKLAGTGMTFHGLHGFRRGSATTLSGLGIPDVVTQQILRHSSVEVTRKHYIKVPSGQANEAMKELAKALEVVDETKPKTAQITSNTTL